MCSQNTRWPCTRIPSCLRVRTSICFHPEWGPRNSWTRLFLFVIRSLSASPKKSIPKAILRRNTFRIRILSIWFFGASWVTVPPVSIIDWERDGIQSVKRLLCLFMCTFSDALFSSCGEHNWENNYIRACFWVFQRSVVLEKENVRLFAKNERCFEWYPLQEKRESRSSC